MQRWYYDTNFIFWDNATFELMTDNGTSVPARALIGVLGDAVMSVHVNDRRLWVSVFRRDEVLSLEFDRL